MLCMQDIDARNAEMECACQNRQFSYRNAVIEILSELNARSTLEIRTIHLQRNQYFKA